MVANLSNAEFLALCRKHGACDAGIKYLEQSGHDLATFWHTSDKPQWMLWLIGRQIGIDEWPTPQEFVLATCACVEPVLKYVPAGEDRPRNAIETARRWCRGEATLEEVRKAADAAYATTYAADATTYAADAAYAATYAAYAADAADAAYAATCAAYANMANIIRQMIPLKEAGR